MPRTLLLAIHNHQPVGNFDEVFARAVDGCYQPFLAALERHGGVRVALHYTGPLLEWLDRHRPAFLDRVGELARRGQVELLGGGFYEPMLAVLPERDAIGQMHMTREWCERRLGVRPEGMWLAERVWEPDLARIIARAGYRFTLLDDSHFRAAGVIGPLHGYWVTEKAGDALAVFPIRKELRYAIPFRPAGEALAAVPEGIWTYGDDGEKFGMWPGTHDWVWRDGWMEEFLGRLERSEEVVTRRFADVLAMERPSGRVYLPTTSYEEMGEWSLDPRAQRHLRALRERVAQEGRQEEWGPFVRGGFWNSFFCRYPESNFLHKKMLYVSRKLERAAALAGHEAVDEARRSLYRGQCNCAYWHGLFGGMYLGFLRAALWRELLTAEARAQALLGEPQATCEVDDLDADLRDEVRLRGGDWIVAVKPDAGGVAFEISHLGRRAALADVIARREEGYHDHLARQVSWGEGGPRTIHELSGAREAGLDALLRYDRDLHLGFVDHLLPEDTTEERFAAVAWEPVLPLEQVPYAVVEARAVAAHASLAMRGAADGLAIEKRIVVSQMGVLATWRLRAARPLRGLFASEVPAPLGLDVQLRVARAGAPWRIPISTVSQSEQGAQRTEQGHVLLAPVRVDLAPGDEVEIEAELRLAP